MERKLMIKILKILEKAYPFHYKAEDLGKKVGFQFMEEEFFQVIDYLKKTDKIKVIFPESRNLPSGREKLPIWIIPIDEITITPSGIDFLTELKKLEAEEMRNRLSLDSMIILTQIAIVGFIIAFFDKLNLSLSPDTKIPFFVSIFFWIILVSFLLLFLYKALNIIFSKESWKGILFSYD